MLRRCGEGEEAQVRLPAALGHAAKEFLHVFPAFLGRELPSFLPQPFAAQHFLETGSSLTALRAVRLVHYDCATAGGKRSGSIRAALLGHLQQLARHEREFL